MALSLADLYLSKLDLTDSDRSILTGHMIVECDRCLYRELPVLQGDGSQLTSRLSWYIRDLLTSLFSDWKGERPFASNPEFGFPLPGYVGPSVHSDLREKIEKMEERLAHWTSPQPLNIPELGHMNPGEFSATKVRPLISFYGQRMLAFGTNNAGLVFVLHNDKVELIDEIEQEYGEVISPNFDAFVETLREQ